MDCGADELAGTLLTNLTTGTTFTLPTVDLSTATYAIPAAGTLDDDIAKLTVADLTSGVVSGTGVFDELMKSLKAHIQQEYDKGRITGEQYAKVYIALVEGAMSQSVAFLLGKETAYWQARVAQQQALTAQVQVATAKVQHETAKAQLMASFYEGHNQQANYALTKMKLSSESMAYCIAKYQHEFLMPAQLTLIKEQGEAQRAQTLDTRSDAVTPVVGVLGKQRELYAQQITSYKRDAEIKAAKIFSDAWITMKTIDEGLLPPTGFENANLDAILTSLKTNNQL